MDEITADSVRAEDTVRGRSGRHITDEVFEGLKRCADMQTNGYGNIKAQNITVSQIANLIGVPFNTLKQWKQRHAKLYSRLMASEGHKRQKQLEHAAAVARTQQIRRRIKMADDATDTYAEIMGDRDQPGVARIKAAEKIDEAIGLNAAVEQLVVHRLSESTINSLRELRDTFGDAKPPMLEAESVEVIDSEEVEDDDESAASGS